MRDRAPLKEGCWATLAALCLGFWLTIQLGWVERDSGVTNAAFLGFHVFWLRRSVARLERLTGNPDAP